MAKNKTPVTITRKISACFGGGSVEASRKLFPGEPWYWEVRLFVDFERQHVGCQFCPAFYGRDAKAVAEAAKKFMPKTLWAKLRDAMAAVEAETKA